MWKQRGVRWLLQQDAHSFIHAGNTGLEKEACAWIVGAEGTVRCPHGYNFHCSFLPQMLNAYDMQVPEDTNMTKMLFCSSKNVHSIDGSQKNKRPSGMEQGLCGCTECWGTPQRDAWSRPRGLIQELVPADLCRPGPGGRSVVFQA